MKTLVGVSKLALVLCICTAAQAQVLPFSSAQLGLTQTNLQSAVVLGNGTPTNVIVPVNQAPTSDDLIDIIATDPGTRVSIIPPNGTEIVATDGTSSNGLTFNVYSITSDSSL